MGDGGEIGTQHGEPQLISFFQLCTPATPWPLHPPFRGYLTWIAKHLLDQAQETASLYLVVERSWRPLNTTTPLFCKKSVIAQHEIVIAQHWRGAWPSCPGVSEHISWGGPPRPPSHFPSNFERPLRKDRRR